VIIVTGANTIVISADITINGADIIITEAKTTVFALKIVIADANTIVIRAQITVNGAKTLLLKSKSYYLLLPTNASTPHFYVLILFFRFLTKGIQCFPQ
jgi:hypothetical protein